MSDKLVIKRGEAKTITFTVEDALGAGVDLSQATVLLGVKKDRSEAAYTFFKADQQFDKSQAASGILSVALTAADTNQPEGTYVGELQFTWTGPVIKKSKDFFLQVKRAVTA
jgi:hypothetical protein